jgi:hypothetical protein
MVDDLVRRGCRDPGEWLRCVMTLGGEIQAYGVCREQNVPNIARMWNY